MLILNYSLFIKVKENLKCSSLNHVQLLVTTWAVAHWSSLSMGFSRQEYWSGLPFPFPGDLPDPGIEPGSPSLQADSLPSEPSGDSNHLKGRGAWWSAVHGVLKSQA